jgi:hypothetical protein
MCDRKGFMPILAWVVGAVVVIATPFTVYRTIQMQQKVAAALKLEGDKAKAESSELKTALDKARSEIKHLRPSLGTVQSRLSHQTRGGR